MADGGESSEATNPAEVSSYETSQLRLQDSYKSMTDAYHKMMSSAERVSATLREIIDGMRPWREEFEDIQMDDILSQEIDVSKSLTNENLNDQEIPEVFTIQENIDRLSGIEGRPFDFGKNVPEFSTDDMKELLRVEVIANLIEDMNQEIKQDPDDLLVHTIPVMADALKRPETDDDIEGTLTQHNCLKVNLDSSEFIVGDTAINELGELVNLLIELLEIRMTNFRMISIECLGNLSARKVFEKMPRRKGSMLAVRVDEKFLVSYVMELTVISWPYDRGKTEVVKGGNSEIDKKYVYWCTELGCREVSLGVLIFDSGGMYAKIDNVGQSILDRNFDFKLIDNGLKSLPFDRGGVALTGRGFSFVFDPGGIHGGSSTVRFLIPNDFVLLSAELVRGMCMVASNQQWRVGE